VERRLGEWSDVADFDEKGQEWLLEYVIERRYRYVFLDPTTGEPTG
jgi:hypothetical protein